MSREGCAIYKQGVAADRATVPNVRIRQKKIAVTQMGFPPAFLRPTAYGDVCAKIFAAPRNQLSALTKKDIILGPPADRAERIKRIVLSELRRSPHHRVGVQHAAIAQFHFLANHGVCADFYSLAKLCARRNHSLRMNFAHRHFAGSSALPAGSRSEEHTSELQSPDHL